MSHGHLYQLMLPLFTDWLVDIIYISVRKHYFYILIIIIIIIIIYLLLYNVVLNTSILAQQRGQHE